MKKLIISPLLLLIGASSMGCALANSSSNVNHKEESITQTQFVLASKLASSIGTGSFAKRAIPQVEETPVQDPLAEVMPMFEQADFIINQGKNSLTSKKETSDLEEYENKEVIGFKDVDGTDKELTLYYNVTFNEDVEEDESEKEETRKGIIKSDSFEYPFISKDEIEEEQGEKETSYEITIQTGIDSFITSEQSFEEEVKNGKTVKEEKYSYTVVTNGKVSKEYSYEFETGKDNVTEIELEYNGVEYEMTSFIKENQEYLKLEIENDATDEETSYLYLKSVDENNNVTYTLVK